MADLYALLGLPSDADADRLRHTYEQHVSAAVRSYDHQRAVALSAAFDALPPERRHQLYPRLTSRAAVATARPARRSARGRPDRCGTPRSRPATSLRRVFACLVLPIVVTALTVVAARRTHHPVLHAAPPPPAPVAVASATITYAMSARHDAELLVVALTQCQKMIRGPLPDRAVATPVGASFECGNVTVTAHLQAGDRWEYLRTSPRTYRLAVTTADGDTARYSSSTGKYS